MEANQAPGMTVVDLGVRRSGAVSRVRAHAYTENRSLGDVAREVVAGQLRLEP
jgi:hypothetical protein